MVELSETFVLHPALQTSELQYQRRLASAIISIVLPPPINRAPVVRSLIRELLANCVRARSNSISAFCIRVYVVCELNRTPVALSLSIFTPHRVAGLQTDDGIRVAILYQHGHHQCAARSIGARARARRRRYRHCRCFDFFRHRDCLQQWCLRCDGHPVSSARRGASAQKRCVDRGRAFRHQRCSYGRPRQTQSHRRVAFRKQRSVVVVVVRRCRSASVPDAHSVRRLRQHV